MKRLFSPAFLFVCLAPVTVLGGACSVRLDASFIASAAEDDESDATGPTGGSSGGGSTGDIALPGPAEHAPDGTTSYTHLCGDGCMSGESSIGCAIPMSPEESNVITCQIVPTAHGASAQCLPAGTFAAGEPCVKTSDCGPGLGCVITGSSVGSCRAYCCGDVEACEAGTYCAPAPMADDAGGEAPLEVPACVPAAGCTLLDDTTCPEGTTCTLVRLDGTTSCVAPGAGKLGDPCPCSAGHVCAKALKTCLALCHVGGSDCPDGMICQGGAESFPDGIGVCVK